MTYNLNKYLSANTDSNLSFGQTYKMLDGNMWKKYSNLEEKLYKLDQGFHGSYKGMNGGS